MNGLKTVWCEEQNFRIDILVAFLVLIFAFVFKFSFSELLAIFVAIILVASAEMVNTAIEDLCNKVQPNQDPLIGKIKDIMAGFVLFISSGSAVIGLLVLAHHFLNYF